MLHPEGLQVEIRSVATNNQYREDDGAGNISADDKTMVRYVEAISDERFFIQVTISPKFLYHQAAGIRLMIEIDGGVVREWHFIPKPYVDRRKHALIFNKSYSREYVNGLWAKVGFTFAELRIDKDLVTDAALLRSQLSNLGKITVTIQRGFLGTKIYATKKERGPAPTDTAASNFIEDTNISHAVKWVSQKVNNISAEQNYRLDQVGFLTKAPMDTHYFKPIGAKRGKKFVFEFRYRSRVSLGGLGVHIVSPKRLPLTNATIVGPIELGDEQDVWLEDCSTSSSFLPPRPPLDTQPLDPPQAVMDEVPESSTEGSTDLLSMPTRAVTPTTTIMSTTTALPTTTVLSTIAVNPVIAVKREVDNKPCSFPIPRKRAKTVDLTAESPEPDTPLIKPKPHQGPGTTSHTTLPTIDLTAEQVTDPSSVKQEFRAGGATGQAADRHSEELDEDDIHMELKRVELEERRLNLQQRLKKLQRARTSSG